MNHSLLLIKGKNESFAALVADAMETAFPGAEVRTIESLEVAKATPQSCGAEILLLLDPSGSEISDSEEAFDERKLPRWAVLVCSGRLAPENWTASIAPYLLKAAWSAQELRRDNARLRGDIKSLGVRVAHDMRTPLGGILSAAETLKEGIAATDAENLVWVDNIIDSNADLLRIVRHQTMLAEELSRPLEISEFNMGDAVGRALERVEGKLAIAKATLSKPADWPTVQGDEKKCERVWILLLENAVRHGGAGRRVELGWERRASDYRFWVSNDGPAVPLEKLPMLFKPFHRLHEPNSGRGLSLSLIEELVNVQGGVSGYETGPTKNPIFFFTVQG